jgi:peptide/nickel transport system substrate-binding protein
LEPYPYDPDRARELLAEAATMESPEVTFYVTEGGSGMLDPIAMGTAIQADLEAVGMDVSIETYEWNTFLGEGEPGPRRQGRHGRNGLDDQRPGHVAVPGAAYGGMAGQGRLQLGLLLEPESRRVAGSGSGFHRSGRARALYKEMQAIVQEDAPWVFVANWKQNAVTNDRVENFRLEPSFLLQLQDVVKN